MKRKEPPPKRQSVPSAFDDLPVGGCYLCHELIWEADEMTNVRVGNEIKRRHRAPCYSEDVPW